MICKKFLFQVPWIACVCIASVCSAATLSLGGGGVHAVGDTFSIPVYVSTAVGESMNAVSGAVTFSRKSLQVVSLNSTGIIDFWAEKPHFSNADGIVSFQGITYNPGFSGTNGKIITIVFKALSEGSAQLSFDSPSVLANDGQGTEILTDSSGTTLTLRASSPPLPRATSTPIRSTSGATSSSALPPRALLDVSAEPAPIAQVEYGLAVLTIPVIILALGCTALAILWVAWYVWHRMHRVRRTLLKHIASTDTVLHERLFSIHDALKDEVDNLIAEKEKRQLTTEEKRLLTRLTELIEETERQA